MRNEMVRNDLLPGRSSDESAPGEDQTPKGRGCDAASADGCADGMEEAISEMIAASSAWIDFEDAARGMV